VAEGRTRKLILELLKQTQFESRDPGYFGVTATLYSKRLRLREESPFKIKLKYEP